MAMKAFRQTLAGLQGVTVQVEPLDAEAERDGLVRADLQAEVEAQLRAAGIHLYTQAALFAAAPSTPVLQVDVATIRLDARYGYAIRLELWQGVRLEREPDTRTLGATWAATAIVGTVAAHELPSVAEALRGAVAEFVEDYRAVNPGS